jgi:three-Cys-motif partner protein
MATNPKKFKQSQTSSSKLKTQIVVEYYKTWIEVMFRNVANYGYKYGTKKHFAYIDLFAGSGTYDDGSHGTAAEIIKCIVSDPKQIDAVETVFNDMHKKSIESLSGCIGDICSNVNFRYPPKFFNEKVDIDFVNKILTQNIPTLFFLDPWGYKGLSLEAIRLGSSSFGCDGFFFFNYDGINRSLKEDNNLLEHMRLLFGSQAESLIKEVKSLEPSAREEKIVKTFEQEVRKIN